MPGTTTLFFRIYIYIYIYMYVYIYIYINFKAMNDILDTKIVLKHIYYIYFLYMFYK